MVLTTNSSTQDHPGPNCESTQVGYTASLLLPININPNEEESVLPPYTATRPYFVVTSGDAKSMVMVPIAAAFEIVGLLLNIVAAGCGNLLFGWVSPPRLNTPADYPCLC